MPDRPTPTGERPETQTLIDTEQGELLLYNQRDPLSLSARVFTFTHRGGEWRAIKVRHGGTDVAEVYVSPTGRSVRVYANGKEVPRG